MRGRGEEGMRRRGEGRDEREGRRGDGSGQKCRGHAAGCTQALLT